MCRAHGPYPSPKRVKEHLTDSSVDPNVDTDLTILRGRF